MHASVIVPTHNRPGKLADLLEDLQHQDTPSGDYEIIVVDDNSRPPVALQKTEDDGPQTLLVWVGGIERSAARNRGAALARGETVIFVDDDMKVDGDFISSHLRAQQQYPGALVVGSVRLPQEALKTPFGRFRQRLEDKALPDAIGPTSTKNFCTAQNMSIARHRFLEIGGFEQAIVSSEDQDLALRYKACGGEMIFLPAARAIHCDDALDIRSYCRRGESGSRKMIPFCERYPDLPDNVERNRVNGSLRLGREPVSQSTRKLVKRALATKPAVEMLFGIASLLERVAPDSLALDRVYRLLLGAHIFRGHREGLSQSAISDQQSAIKQGVAADPYLQADR